MQLQRTKRRLAVVWILVAGAAALAADVASVGGGILAVSFAFVPPLIMLLRWNEPPQTLSESIHEARR